MAKELLCSASLCFPSAGTTLPTVSVSSTHNERHYLNAEDDMRKAERVSYDWVESLQRNEITEFPSPVPAKCLGVNPHLVNSH